ncbi:MAG: hypothetical protein M0R73_04945 [Dehalococcoidia bacterium]|nr:hypothetical protein [Dehalococcoidia bacterium]
MAAVVVGFLTFVAMYPQPGEAQTGLTLTLSAEAVGISISGDGEYDFGGPWAPGLRLRAHPQITQENIVGLPPEITNTGNIPITYIDLAYTGPTGQEAICDAGSGHWAAHASAVAQDRFITRAWASTNANLGTFNSNSEPVRPDTGTGNILQVAPLAVDASVPLLLELWTPSPMLAGAHGCTIGLVVTAAAG